MAGQAAGGGQAVAVAGRTLQVTNLDKPLYPDGPGAGLPGPTTKAMVLAYYLRIAPVLLPHLADRPVTLRRFPDGTGTAGFYAKNVPPGAPSWLRRVRLPSSGGRGGRAGWVEHPLLDDAAGLVWAANLAGLEIHVPQWRVDDELRPRPPDRLVVDLDPGAPAGIAECCAVAVAAAAVLAADGITALPKTSGSKGLQLVAALPGDQPAGEVAAYAKGLAQRLERDHPALVVSRMTRALRPGKVLVDWSQNAAAKTTVAPYSLRATGPAPTVSTPVTWQEVLAGADGAPLRFLAEDVLARVADHGDLLEVVASGGGPA